MADTLKAVLFVILAQALFVLRARLGAAYLGSTGALALTAVMTTLGGGAIALTRWSQVKTQLSLKVLSLAALAAVLGIALHASLDLAGRELAGRGVASLAAYTAPVLLLLLAAALKWEPLDRLRLGALVFGMTAVAWLIAGPDTIAAAFSAPRGAMMLLLAALATAAFLATAQRLVQASSASTAAALVLLAGGVATGALAGLNAATEAAASVATGGLEAILVGLALAGGTALAYVLLFHGLQRLKLTTVGASYLAVAPLSAAYMMVVEGATISQGALAGAAGALAAFGVVAARDKA